MPNRLRFFSLALLICLATLVPSVAGADAKRSALLEEDVDALGAVDLAGARQLAAR
jgi:hypothetical protein